MRLTRSLAAAAVTPLLVITLAACGPDDSKDSESAPSNRAGSSALSSPAPSGQEINTGEFATLIAGAFEKADTANMEMQLIQGGVVTTFTGQVDYSGEAPQMTMTLDAPATGTGPMTSIVVDNKMYVAPPNPDPDAETVYFMLDLSDEKNPMVKSLGGNATFDPKATIEIFAQGLESVVLVGTDSVEGTPTKHYVVTTSTEAVSDLGGTELENLPASLTYDVWLDDKGRLAKMEAEYGEQGSMRLTMTNWGGKVDIAAPSAAQVQPYPTDLPVPKN